MLELQMKQNIDPALKALLFAIPGVVVLSVVILVFAAPVILQVIFSGLEPFVRILETLILAQAIGSIFAFRLLAKSQNRVLAERLKLFFIFLLFAVFLFPLTTLVPY